ncbi:MAG: hypothetical protein KatS3mg011_0151 [Acidimicrobiia bacterium]|nr:MAG: hypothetical protein KatS3mg011_0151 [Acidimicrobiia bacterium]
MRGRFAVALTVLALGLVSALPAGGETPPAKDFEEIDLGGVSPTLLPALADPNREITVMVELTDPPVAVHQAQARAAGRELSKAERAAIRQSIKQKQDGLQGAIRRLGGRVVNQLADAYNGIRVTIPARAVPELASLPGVAAVRDLVEHEPVNANSVPFLGTPQAWESLGLTGEGVKIAIIDTGIDYYHANFGGSGDPADYAADDPTIIEAGTFPTIKVAGGFDFAGDDYDASDPDHDTPMPDPDPLDCNGHGTHVAGTAAGFGVLLDGTTYPGPYDTSTHNHSFAVGPGMAPQATLYALKVFGCEGSTTLTVDAIDWAVANDMDVINMSLGAPFGRADDPSAIASTNAAAAGVIVVASAGNSGSSPYITGSPAAGVGAISVAALDSIEGLPHADFTVPGEPADVIDMQNSNGADLSTPITAQAVVLKDDPTTPDVDESLGCNESDYPDVSGKVAITFRGVCARVARAIHGQSLGAAAVVMINNTGGFPPFEGPIAGVTIPFLGALQADTPRIVAADGLEVTISDAGLVPNPAFRDFAGFTSGGPRNGDSGLKPDVTAPGVSIVSSLVGSGTGGLTASGTSMAAPHVAGLAALVRQAHPDWSVEDVKAAIVNTADPTGIVGYSTRRGGSGLVSPLDAASTTLVAVGDPGTASLSFGYVEGTGTITRTSEIEVRNHGTSSATVSPSVEWNTNPGGAASISFSPKKITVQPGKSKKVNATLKVDASAVPDGFQTASGNVVLTAAGHPTLRVPFLEVVRGEASVRTTPGRVNLPPGADEASFMTTNPTGAAGTADVYAWGLTDPADATVTDVRAVGVQAFPGAVGGLGLGVFAINTHQRVSNPSVNEWDVLLDVDEDGAFDYAVVGYDIGAVFTGSFDGQLGSFTIDLSTGTIVRAFSPAGGLDTSTVLLPFLLADVGLTGPDTDFTYVSGVFSLEGFPDDFVDGAARFDVAQQPVDTGAFFELGPGDSVAWSAAVDRDSLAANPVRGWMVVYTENGTGGDQADLIPLTTR